MALPSTGALAFSAIRQELTLAGYVGSYSLNAFDGMAFGGATPNYTSEFYGYSAAPAETIEWYDWFSQTYNYGYFPCGEQILVGYSSLGRYYNGGDFNQPLDGYYGDSSGHVFYFSNGYKQWGAGWCEYI